MSANGSLVDWMDGLRDLIANAPAFQTLTETTTAAEARANILYDAKLVNSQTIEQDGDQFEIYEHMPCALVSLGEWRYSQYSGGTRNYLAATGSVDLEFAVAADMKTVRSDDTRAFHATIGNVIDWVAEHCGDGVYAPFREIELVIPPMRIVRDEKTAQLGRHWFFASFAFLFDANGGD